MVAGAVLTVVVPLPLMSPCEYSFDPARFDIGAIHAFLTGSSWSPGIPRATVARAIAHSLCIGGYVDGAQVAFARVVTDRATFAYLADVFVLPAYRGRGIARALLETLFAHPDLQGLRRVLLATRDAHGLYARLGFTPLSAPDRFMERHTPHAYQGVGEG